MHFNRFFKPAIMGDRNIGITSAAVGVHDHIPLLVLCQILEQLPAGQCVGSVNIATLDERVRRATNHPIIGWEENVAVTAKRCVAGPFIPGKRNECTRRIVFCGQRIQFSPELVGNLKVVALVRTGIHECQFAGKREVPVR